MGKLLISLGALVLIGLVAGSLVYGATTTGPVTVSVSAQSISVNVTDGAVAYGSVALSATASTTTNGTTHDSQTATNDGNQAETFNIKSQNASSTGTAWTLISTTTASDLYKHAVCTSTCDASPTWRQMSTGYITLDANIAQSGTSIFDLQIDMPTASSDTYNHSANVTVQAVAYP
jgi:Tfp pilus assembly protein PilX